MKNLRASVVRGAGLTEVGDSFLRVHIVYIGPGSFEKNPGLSEDRLFST
jgi:hypothetical protein